jgi:hypothetical protein
MNQDLRDTDWRIETGLQTRESLDNNYEHFCEIYTKNCM